MLLFKKKFLEQIKRGEKTQTIRFWKHRRVSPGQRSYIPGIGYIDIVSVEQVELARLTDEDALLDGFPSARSLRKEIKTLYPADMRKKMIPFKICFSIYPPQEQEKMRLERLLKKQEQEQNKQRQGQEQYERVRKTLDKLLNLIDS